MRILLSEYSRKELFDALKVRYESKTYKELSERMDIPFKTVQKWRLGERLIPEMIIPSEIMEKISIVERRPDNWGRIKGGKSGIDKKIKHLEKMWHDPKYREIRRETGRKAIINLLKESNPEIVKKSRETKIRKREEIMRKLEIQNNPFFTNKEINFENAIHIRNKYDIKKKIHFPHKMTVDLAEEIGIHLGDGCLSLNKKYFSVKTNKKERDYMECFIIPLYKKLYNLDLRLMELKSVVGFEIYSQAFFDFKNKILKIPYGNKVEKLSVPESILNSQNKEVYRAFIRGLFDTDGCVNIVKSKNYYPTVSFTIKSEKLIKQVGEMLNKLGFVAYVGKWKIDINGRVMVNKWLKEIGSNNPKNLVRLKQACSSVG